MSRYTGEEGWAGWAGLGWAGLGCKRGEADLWSPVPSRTPHSGPSHIPTIGRSRDKGDKRVVKIIHHWPANSMVIIRTESTSTSFLSCHMSIQFNFMDLSFSAFRIGKYVRNFPLVSLYIIFPSLRARTSLLQNYLTFIIKD